MVRRSSLIIAASLAVLSTFEPGSLCFAAAAPAAQPAAEDRFERPRFMKKEIKRFVFMNTTMTHSTSSTSEEHITPLIKLPDTTIPADVLAASLASVSLASAEASWSAAHPGVPFGGVLGDSTTSVAAASSTSAAAASTTQPPAAKSTQPPPGSQTDSQGPGQAASSSGSAAQGSAQGSSDEGNPPNSTPTSPTQGGTTHSQPDGGVIPSVSVPSVSVPGVSVPSVSTPSLSIPVESDASHTESVQQPTGQPTGGQPTGGQETVGQETGGQSTGGQQTGGQQTGGQQTGGQQTGGQQTGGQQTGGQQTGGQQTGGQQTGGQQTGGQQTGQQTGEQQTGQPTGGIPTLSIPVEGDSSHTEIIPSVTPSNGASQPGQTAEPVTGTTGGVTPGSKPTSGNQVLIVPPASQTNSLIAALSSALAISPPVNVQSAVNSLGQTLGSIASPIIIGSSTNPVGVVLPITASTPAESSAGLPPVVIGSTTDSAGNVVPILTANLPSGSVVLPPGVSTNGNGVPVTGSAPALTGSLPPVVASESVPVASGSVLVASGSVPAATGSAPVIVGQSSGSLVEVTPATGTAPPSESTGAAPGIIGSTTNSLGQVVPVTSAPPAGSTTNAQGQVVPISSAASASNDRFDHAAVLPSASVVAGNSQSAQQTAPATGVGATEPANTATSGGQTAASPPPEASTAGPEVPASSALAAPLPIATASQSYNTNQNAPLTQLPTASDSMTAQPLASSIEVASSSSPTAVTGTLETGLPSGVPLVLYPPTGPVNRPANTELIQIGFLYPLNYDFVWQHEESQRQIFHYLPIGIAYGLSIDQSNVTMQTLRAWDTTQDLHYITTLALAWIPSQLVDSLGLILHTQAEKFYHNPDPAVRTLLSMINPALPIRADNATDGGPEDGVGASPSGTANANSGTIANGINNSSPVKASSVGIGVGVVCGAAAYGAAMFFVARRYKKRRQSHLRSPSMYSSPVMSQHGADPAAAAALMSGGMGERSISPYYDNDRGPSRGSGRSGSSAGRQQISAPVMAENSLGWN